MVFDTACSSSLIGAHVARRCMQHRECSNAQLIAPNVILTPTLHVANGLVGMTSGRGRCHTFDSRADGFLRGEACVGTVLEATGLYQETIIAWRRLAGTSA